MQAAISDSQLHIAPRTERHGRILDKDGRIITNSPDLSSPNVGYVKNNLNLDPSPPVRNMCVSNPNLSGVVDTSWLSQESLGRNLARTNWELGREQHTRRGLLGRSAVSYQNISPSGDIFADHNKDSVESNPSSSFSAEGNRSTTNVAWLVGAANPPHEPHHIDIRHRAEIQPPSHLEVAPLEPSLGERRPTEMGYSLARSKTVSDMPLWASDLRSGDSRPTHPLQESVLVGPEDSEAGLTAATVVTMGSLRSKVVKHRTLLGSSSRLYKFSQSLSSLTTLGSESRNSTWERTMSQRKR